jgi:outer membrane murein-binding lipoprotein Lpp
MITRLLFSFLLLGALFSGCKDEPQVPEGTLSEAKMSQILTDIHLLEARIGRLNMPSLDSSTVITEYLKAKILKKHGIDSVVYNRSYKFYSTNPVYMERIYGETVKELEKRQKKKDYKGI